MMGIHSSSMPALATKIAAPAQADASLVAKLLQAFRTFGAAIARGQEARAKRAVRPYLARQDDATLAWLGMDSRQIADLRREEVCGSRPWC